METPADVTDISSQSSGQWAGMTFAAASGATLIAGCFINQLQASFREPSLLVAPEPRAEHQSLTEASYFNLSTVAAQCNIGSPEAVCTLPSHAPAWELNGWVWCGCWPESSVHAWHHLPGTSMGGPDRSLLLQRSWNNPEGRASPAEQAVSKKWTALALEHWCSAWGDRLIRRCAGASA